MENSKASFIIRKKYRKQIELLDDEMAGVLFKAIMKMQDGEVLENTNPVISMLLSLMEDERKQDDIRYKEVCDKNRENVKKRWENKKAIQKDTTVYDRIPSHTTGYDSIRLDTKNTDNDNDNDIEKENLIKEKDASVSNLVGEFEHNEKLMKLYGGVGALRERLEYKQGKKDRAYKTSKGFIQQMQVIYKDIQYGQPRGDIPKRFEFAVNLAMENQWKGIFWDDKIEAKYQNFKSMNRKDDG